MGEKASILVVDDENCILQSFKMVLDSQYHVFTADSGEKALHIFKDKSIDIILLDIIMPGLDGIEMLKQFKELDPNTEVIMVSAVKEVQTAVNAMKFGAYDYIVKPFVVEEILNIVARALEKHQLIREVTYLKEELERFQPFEKMIGQDENIRAVFDLITKIADSDGTVLIQGESGTGKELVARAIHKLGKRGKYPFVVINCAAIPETLMESEIFGHDKGAFTGAASIKVGKLEIADKGIAFLDDIDTLDLGMQAKLLRAIQEKEIERLGTTKTIKIDVRFVAASNKNLKSLVEKDKFREDLYYRLNVFPVNLPPLRERRSDIPLLLNHFLNLHAIKTGSRQKTFSEGFLKTLTDHYEWPGNVRELQNFVERMATISRGNVIFHGCFPELKMNKREIKGKPLKEAVDIFEKQLIDDALKRVHGSRKDAADLLGIHRNTLQKKLSTGKSH